jgi:hypothetical protein
MLPQDLCHRLIPLPKHKIDAYEPFLSSNNGDEREFRKPEFADIAR